MALLKGRARTKRIIELLLQGLEVETIANEVGVTPQRVYQVRTKFFNGKLKKHDKGVFLAGHDRVQNIRVGKFLQRLRKAAAAGSRLEVIDELLPMEFVLLGYLSLSERRRQQCVVSLASALAEFVERMESLTLAHVGRG